MVRLPALLQRVLDAMPRGLALTEEEWRPRHRGIVALLWVHAFALPAFAVWQGWEVGHSVLEGGVALALIAGLASWKGLPRGVRASAASVGLITASALLTHFSGGLIEAHFHFFVVLAVIALYQDWVPFGLSVLFVAVHHGAVGAFDPGSVYNHAAALAQPWTWGLIHAAFVLAESVAILVFWRLSEDARARVDAVLTSAGEGILGLDDAGRVSFANPAACALVQRPQAEVLGLPVAEAVRAGDRAAFTAAAGQGAAAHGLDLMLHRPDGSEVAVDWVSSPVTGSAAGGRVVTLNDATARRQAADLLAREKELAEAGARAKADFLANMSHEIRTPMNAVIGMTSLLQDTRLEPEQREFVETIRSSGEHLLSVINDILDFSKIEAGKLELEEAPFSVRSCIEDALDLVSLRAAEKRIELAYLLEPGVPATVVGDVGRVRQVLVNLLGNAVKFTEQGEVVVAANAEAQPDGTLALHIAVRDTGPGIPPERLDRLFKSFSQVDASTTRVYGGTGLGLAISKRLCERMGGGIEVASRVGEGSTFTLHVRVHALDVPPSAQAEPRRLAGTRVLVVDDNATNRDILTRLCAAWGMVPQATGSPLEALAWVGEGRAFEVALLDFNMPEMDGVSLAAALRGAPAGAGLKMLLLSSTGRTAEQLRTSGADFAACLRKPLKQAVLFDALVGVLHGRPAEAPKPVPAAPITAPAQSLRVLLVEDNTVNQLVARKMLARLGYQADVAANGREAIEAVLRQRYDAVLMDVQMPEMDGLEATRILRQRVPAAEQPRIIAMTANALRGDREACLAAGMDDYVAKPIVAAQLAEALARCNPLRAA